MTLAPCNSIQMGRSDRNVFREKVNWQPAIGTSISKMLSQANFTPFREMNRPMSKFCSELFFMPL